MEESVFQLKGSFSLSMESVLSQNFGRYKMEFTGMGIVVALSAITLVLVGITHELKGIRKALEKKD